MNTYICANKTCARKFEARPADRRRGWARFCSKSCKAKEQTRRTGIYKAYSSHIEDIKRQVEEDGIAIGQFAPSPWTGGSGVEVPIGSEISEWEALEDS